MIENVIYVCHFPLEFICKRTHQCSKPSCVCACVVWFLRLAPCISRSTIECDVALPSLLYVFANCEIVKSKRECETWSSEQIKAINEQIEWKRKRLRDLRLPPPLFYLCLFLLVSALLLAQSGTRIESDILELLNIVTCELNVLQHHRVRVSS